ncbi:MAG: hypothetical protein AB7E32_05455, partial [Desulfovibrio sp.]
MGFMGRCLLVVLGSFLSLGLLFGDAPLCWAAWGEEGGIPLFNGAPGKVWIPIEEQPEQYGQYVREQNATLIMEAPEGQGRAQIGIASRKHLLLVPAEGGEEGLDFEFDPDLTTGMRIVVSDGPLDKPGVHVLVLWWGSGMMGYMTSLEEKQKSITNSSGWKPGLCTLYVAPGKLTLVTS